MFVALNKNKTPSYKDGKIYKYMTKEGKYVCFERNSPYWMIYKDVAVQKPKNLKNIYTDSYSKILN